MARFEVGDVISRSFRLVLQNFTAYLGTQGVFILLAAGVGVTQALLFQNTFSAIGPGTDPEAMAAAMQAAGGAMALSLLTMLILTVGGFFGIVATAELLEGRRPTLGSVWERAGQRFGTFFLMVVLVTLAVMGVGLAGGLLFFLVVPLLAVPFVVVYLFLRWYVAGAVAALEDGVTAKGALKRSSSLTDGAKVHILLLVLALFLIFFLVSLPVFGLQFVMGADPMDPGAAFDPATLVTSQALGAVVQLVLYPVGTAALVFVYRALKEGEAAAAPVGAAGVGGDAGAPGASGAEPAEGSTTVDWDAE